MNPIPARSAITDVATHVVESLERLPDVTSMVAPAGQVLIYPGHFPQGLFVIVRGCVRLEHPVGERALDVAAEAGTAPLVVPPLAELESPAALRVTTAAETRLLFVPRSLALESAVVRRLVGNGRLSKQSLQPHPIDSNTRTTRSTEQARPAR